MSVKSVSKNYFYEYTGLEEFEGWGTDCSWFKHDTAELVGRVWFDECDKFHNFDIYGKDDYGDVIYVAGAGNCRNRIAGLRRAETNVLAMMEELGAERISGFTQQPIVFPSVSVCGRIKSLPGVLVGFLVLIFFLWPLAIVKTLLGKADD